jgi:hypothetical protein
MVASGAVLREVMTAVGVGVIGQTTTNNSTAAASSAIRATIFRRTVTPLLYARKDDSRAERVLERRFAGFGWDERLFIGGQ